MKKLARREEEIMEFLWENGPMFVREIVALYDEPRPHFNTMSTVVRNLETLGYVGHNAYGNTYQYYAAVSRDEYRKMTLRGVVSKYFDNSYLYGRVFSVCSEIFNDILYHDQRSLRCRTLRRYRIPWTQRRGKPWSCRSRKPGSRPETVHISYGGPYGQREYP